jgi:hypothetical protein
LSENGGVATDEWLGWLLQENLNDLVAYHNVVRRLLRKTRTSPEFGPEVGARAMLELFEQLTARMSCFWRSVAINDFRDSMVGGLTRG